MKHCLSPFQHPKEIPVASLVFLGFLVLIFFDLEHLSLLLHLQKLLLLSTVNTGCSCSPAAPSSWFVVIQPALGTSLHLVDIVYRRL